MRCEGHVAFLPMMVQVCGTQDASAFSGGRMVMGPYFPPSIRSVEKMSGIWPPTTAVVRPAEVSLLKNASAFWNQELFVSPKNAIAFTCFCTWSSTVG